MRRILIGIVTVLILGPPVSVSAEERDRLSERFNLSFSSFITDRSTKIRVDSKTLGTGTTLDFQDDLGLDQSATVTRIDGYYRLGRHHRINFSYYDLSRDATKTISKDIQFGDSTFLSGTQLSTHSDVKITKLAYIFSAIRTNKTDIGLSVGLHVLDVDLVLRDNGSNQLERESGTLPLPVFGIRFTHALKYNLFIKGGVDIFAVDTGSYDGRLIDQWIALEHNTYKNVGYGIAYNDFDIDLNINGGDIRGTFDLDYRGIQLYLKFYF